MNRMKHPLTATHAVVVILALVAVLVLRISTAANDTPAVTAAVDAAPSPTPRVQMETSFGVIVLELDRKSAPETVENFLTYVNDKFYDGTVFHRVIDGFMIQGGGFTESFEKKTTRAPIRNEANNGLKNRRLSISMARTNAPHSATAQFFINTADNGALDHTGANSRGWGYAVFGRVIEGAEVVDKISGTFTGAGGPFSRDTPQTPIVISKAVLLAEEPSEN